MTDLIIIGAGPGGYELALEASKYNLSSILIEAKSLGGTCLNEGCIPTKAYYKNASFIKELSLAKTLGVSLESYQVDFETIKARKDQVVEDLKKGIEFSLKKLEFKLSTVMEKLLIKPMSKLAKRSMKVNISSSQLVQAQLSYLDLKMLLTQVIY